ncbi:MAG: integrase arm-type DNA-binding domain-containing protein, partial [Syntrophobacterales bacterium]|nr:integrase arm-type DNA-binding domain-containing protein [Syntrophobacterales bacterium]
MKLTDVFLRGIKPSGQVQKKSDGGGLYIHVSMTGVKLWRMAYSFDGKQKTLSFGQYPTISLKDARSKRDGAKEMLAKGIDPGAAKKEARIKAVAAAREDAATFEFVAREWYVKNTKGNSPGHQKTTLARLEKQLFPYIGGIPFSRLEPSDILAAVNHAAEQGIVETAHRLVSLAGQVCRYAKRLGHTKYDAAAGLSEALPAVQTTNYAAITNPLEIGCLLRDIDSYQGDIRILYALRIMPYVFVRSGELRGAEWSEVNFDAAEWIIPAGRMKMKRPHVVPLAKQVIKLFQEKEAFTNRGNLIYPGVKLDLRP